MSRPPFARSYGPWAIVAGASEGLGAAFAGEIARRGVHLVLVARRQEPLAQTAARLRREHGVEVITTRRQAPGATSPELVAAPALRALGHGFRVVPGWRRTPPCG